MKKLPSFKYLFGIADILVLFMSFSLAAYYLRYDKSLSFATFMVHSPSLIILFLLLASIFLIVFQYNNLYRVNIIITRASHLVHIIKAMYYGALNVVLVSLFMETSGIIDSRFLIFVFVLIAIPILYFLRIEFLRFLFLNLSNTSFKRNVLIIGDGKAGKLLATKLMFENPIGLNIVGFINNINNTNHLNSEVVIGKKILGDVDQISTIVNKHDVDEIIVNDDGENTEETLRLIDYCKTLNVTVRVTSELFNVVARKLNTEKYIDVPVIDVSSHYNNSITLTMKRVTDIVISVFALVILAPIIILISVLIKISSPGPILFSQMRIGKYGKEFKFYKFRSMKVTDEKDEERIVQMLNFMKDDSQKTKIINDKRVTWIGKLIRKTSLDELPQLFNVLKGDMSLVGPRPCLPYEYKNYDEWQKRRVNVIPGCTGVWQVWGRSSVSFKESVILDLYYMNNMSPWFDLQLLFQTIPAILTARGAK
jgi:exopolysaccharide biosynthesis polyprenyl glycosylphosphotransferase